MHVYNINMTASLVRSLNDLQFSSVHKSWHRTDFFTTPADQSTSGSLVSTVTSCCISHLTLSCSISGRKIFSRRPNVAAVEPLDTIRDPYDRNVPLPLDLNATMTRYSRLNTTCNVLKHQTADKKRLAKKQLLRLDIDCVSLIKNHRDRSAFVFYL